MLVRDAVTLLCADPSLAGAFGWPLSGVDGSMIGMIQIFQPFSGPHATIHCVAAHLADVENPFAAERLVRLSTQVGLALRQSYVRVGKKALIAHQRYANAKQFNRAGKALKTLKTYLGRTCRPDRG